MVRIHCYWRPLRPTRSPPGEIDQPLDQVGGVLRRVNVLPLLVHVFLANHYGGLGKMELPLQDPPEEHAQRSFVHVDR